MKLVLFIKASALCLICLNDVVNLKKKRKMESASRNVAECS